MSTKEEQDRDLIAAWLADNGIAYDAIIVRAVGQLLITERKVAHDEALEEAAQVCEARSMSIVSGMLPLHASDADAIRALKEVE